MKKYAILFSQLAALILFMFAGAQKASSEILLIVDASSPSAVSFASTEGLSQITYQNEPGDYPHLFLRDFFGSDLAEGFDDSVPLMAGDLRSGETAVTFDYINSSAAMGGWPRVFAFYYDSDAEQSAVAGQRALFGSATLDLTEVGYTDPADLTDFLPVGCVSGALHFGAFSEPSEVIGQWQTSQCPVAGSSVSVPTLSAFLVTVLGGLVALFGLARVRAVS